MRKLVSICFGVFLSVGVTQVASAAPQIKKPAVTRSSKPKPPRARMSAERASSRSKDSVLAPMVVAIEVKGNKKIEKDAILTRIKSKEKEPFSKERIHQDVVDLFSMGFFYNIEVDRQPAPGGVKLVYSITEKPSVAEIHYNGQSEISEDDLKEASGLKPYEILNVSSIQTAVEKMEKLYEEKGYFLARVNYKVEDIVPGETVKLTFNIQENDKVRVKRISFLGNAHLSDHELLDKMRTSEEGLFTSGAYKQDVFDRDIQIINSLYFNKGYVQVKINKPEVTVTPDKRHIYISIRIEEGDQFNVGEVDFAGDLLFSREELFNSIKIQKAGVFSYETLLNDINNLQAKYGDLGYAFANILPRTAVRDKERLVDITFEFDKGNKVYFGEINVVGNSKTRDKVVRRELKVRETELFNETRRRESLANVKRLGFFEDVNFNQKTQAENPDKVDYDIVVKERNTGSIQVGAGFSSYSGFVFNGQVQQSNLLGKGQRLGVSVDLSQKASMFNLNFTEPYFLDTEWSLGFDAYRSQRQLTPYDEIKEGGAVRVGHPLAPYLMGFIRYKNEHTNLSLKPIDGGDPSVYPVETANGRTSSVTFTLEYDKRNDRISPSDGIYSSASVEYAGVGGDKKYTKGFLIGRYYKELFGDIVFRNNLTYGVITTPDNIQPPFNELFLLGGANTLRGFTWFSVGRKKSTSLIRAGAFGPGNPASDIPPKLVPFGGQQEAFYNGEFEFPLISEAGIKGVVFYDTGYADDNLSWPDLRSDYGFGFRWFSPIGPLRFEWGFPINKRDDESSVNFEFSIGSPF